MPSESGPSTALAESGTSPGGAKVVLRTTAGEVVPMNLGRWTGDASAADDDLLARSIAPVVDLGCGPGRHVVALASRGIPALGVDSSPAAVALARSRGATVLERCIFEPIPGTGRWGSALLLDGNIGIGGDPVRLLERVAELVGPTGRALIEVGAPGSRSERLTVRVESRDQHSAWFPWSMVAVDDVWTVASATGWTLSEVWTDEARWFVQLDRHLEHHDREPDERGAGPAPR